MKARTNLLGLSLVAACRLPSATITAASESAELPPTFVETTADPEQKQPEDPPVSKIAPGECPVEVEDFPEAYFHERVLIRAPRDVADFLVEVAPNRAVLSKPTPVPTCRADRPHVTLERMIIELRDPDPGGRIEDIRNEVMRAHGLFEDAVLIEAEVDIERRDGEWVFELPGRKLLAVVRTANKGLVVVMYLVATEDWPLVVESLRGSGKRVALVPN